jgi:hypothetical protein
MSTDTNDLFDAGDPFDDPHWQVAANIASAPARPAKGYVTCPLSWLAKVRPLVASADQLLVLLLLYRQCLVRRVRTVPLSNGDLQELGIGRMTKYRTLHRLAEVGAIAIETRNGRATRVTLNWFP